jgi:hypothetical protein
MGKYTIIADTGQRLVEILRRELVPGVIQNPNEIGLRSPEERGDVSLGLFLYSVEECEEVRQAGTAIVRNDIRSKVPVYLSLYYMVTAYSSGDLQYRMTQEEQILGRVIQVFHDHSLIPLEEVDAERMSGMDLRISMLRLNADEKSKIWSFPNVGNRLSLFYKVTPVAIDSAVMEKVTRVTELDINVDYKDGRK